MAKGRKRSKVGRPISQERAIPDDIIELAEENGISYELLYSRYYSGMDMFDAAITPHRKPGKESKFSEKELETLAKNGLTQRNANSRMRYGWSKYEAVNTPKGERRR